MNLIQALRLPNSQAVMTNIARFHYQNIYNVGLTPPIFTQSNLTFQIISVPLKWDELNN